MTISDLEFLAYKLIRSGVAPRVAKRLTRELKDHHADAIAEHRSDALADKKLGEIDSVVAAVLSDPNHQSWSRSAPFLAYVLVPLGAYLAAVVITFLVTDVIAEWGKSIPTVRAALDWMFAVVSDWAEIFTAIGVWVFARRSYSPLLMPLLGTLIILSIGSGFSMRMIWPIDTHGDALMSMSLAFPNGNMVRASLFGVAAGVAYYGLLLRAREMADS